jgi:glycine cleavage system H protein
MDDLRYSEDHEWVRVEGDLAVVGISDYAQDQLGDVVYVELPDIGTEVVRDEEAVVIESVKAASEVKMPVSGRVTAINERLADDPGLVNSDPTEDGWLIKIEMLNDSELDDLMDEDSYREFVEGMD